MLNIPGQPEGTGVGMMNIGDIFGKAMGKKIQNVER